MAVSQDPIFRPFQVVVLLRERHGGKPCAMRSVEMEVIIDERGWKVEEAAS